MHYFIIRGQKVPAVIKANSNKTITLSFGYNRRLVEEVKMLAGARWNPEDKTWTVKNCPRNLFALKYLLGQNPYERYDSEMQLVKPSRDKVLPHQIEMISHVLARKQAILACEMGTGKTLAAIESMELSGNKNWWWVGPKSALLSVRLEFRKWNSFINPLFLTYEGLKKVLSEWTDGKPPPKGLFVDESSRTKNIKSQRTQAVLHLANSMREHWKDDCYIVLMSGSPAPKSPLDWWSQAEIACPGFLKEGDIFKFQRSLAIVEQRSSNITGGMYPHLVTWKDDSSKCTHCGRMPETHVDMDHLYEPSTNEVERLYKRLSGLVLVKFKKETIKLPEKKYTIIRCEPSIQTLQYAELITANTESAAVSLVYLRELSDGFQYEKIEGDKFIQCVGCEGSGQIPEFIDDEDVDDEGPTFVSCPNCQGAGKVKETITRPKRISTPKDEVLKKILETHKDIRRLVVYAGFTESIDRICDLVAACGWEYIKVDGRGWHSSFENDSEKMIISFQDKSDSRRIVFIGHPGSAGMGLTLTASPTIVYYSNDFNAESRIQSEDRIHRLGMDYELGANIIDIFHLPTDEMIHDNLTKKRNLQSLTMGEVKQALKCGEKLNASDNPFKERDQR